MFTASDRPDNLNDFTKMRTPHTYAIIFCVVLFSWILTFIVPAGRFSTHDVQYKDAKGNTKTRTVLMPETFRYSYNLDSKKLSEELAKLAESPQAKTVIVPAEMSALVGTVGGIGELVKSLNGDGGARGRTAVPKS